MPIYEYRCLDCNTKFEQIVSLTSPKEKITCVKCKSGRVQKAISASSYRLSTSSGSSIPSGALSGCSSSSGFS